MKICTIALLTSLTFAAPSPYLSSNCRGEAYLFQSGDSVSNLTSSAGKFSGYTVDQVKALNPLVSDLGLIEVGQKICFPKCRGEAYLFQSGDSVSSLITIGKFKGMGLNLEDVTVANPGININRIHVGQKVCFFKSCK